jgi:hypothetical protein
MLASCCAKGGCAGHGGDCGVRRSLSVTARLFKVSRDRRRSQCVFVNSSANLRLDRSLALAVLCWGRCVRGCSENADADSVQLTPKLRPRRAVSIIGGERSSAHGEICVGGAGGALRSGGCDKNVGQVPPPADRRRRRSIKPGSARRPTADRGLPRKNAARSRTGSAGRDAAGLAHPAAKEKGTGGTENRRRLQAGRPMATLTGRHRLASQSGAGYWAAAVARSICAAKDFTALAARPIWVSVSGQSRCSMASRTPGRVLTP